MNLYSNMLYFIDMLINIVKLLRPKQWIKNLIIFAAIIFSGKLFELDFLYTTVIGFILFCGISSSIYILNDIIDLERDKLHYKKRYRPIAAGNVSITVAVMVAICLSLVSFIGAYYINLSFFLTVVSYFLLTISYTFVLKNIIILDVMAIATGFLLRAIAGAYLISEYLSNYLIICTTMLALFLVLNKRLSEKRLSNVNNQKTRKILDSYSIDMIDKMLAVVTPSILISYILFSLDKKHSQFFIITTVFVIYGIFRYFYIADKTDLAESPEYALLHDYPLLINVVLWIITCTVLVYI